MNTTSEPIANPYVGPRTFSQEQRHLFFGREREGRDLLARVLSERLVLFYAQSGAGKSSLISARLIPQLREIGYAVLPVARVGGELPAGVEAVENVYLFNLMLSLVQSETAPGRFAHLALSNFLAGLSTDDGEQYTYDEAATPSPAVAEEGTAPAQPYVMIVDQFEELITSHPGRWQERAEFFCQLNQAMLDDPNLWVVLALREDYVAPIEPYAPLLADRMRARFYMERMGVDAALDAIRRPAGLGGRPFAAGAAEQLVEDLRQVRVPGQEATIPGQYVEPVQLQVVCLQLWEGLAKDEEGQKTEDQGRPITFDDLARAGDVDRALTQFYEETLAVALADPAAAKSLSEKPAEAAPTPPAAGMGARSATIRIGTKVTERQLRTWFDKELITEAGTRGLVRQGEETTGSLLNVVVGRLQKRFLVRAEARSGDTWIELVHDRFVEPIRASNAIWFPLHLSALQRQAALWDEQGRSSSLLLRDSALAEAEAWAASHPEEAGPAEHGFLAACRQSQAAVERERRQSRRIRILAVVAGVVAIMALAAAIWAWRTTQAAEKNANLANERLEQMQFLIGVVVEGNPELKRSTVESLVQLGKKSAAAGDFTSAEVYFQKALDLKPDAGTETYVRIPAGEFLMGSPEGTGNPEERPQHSVTLDNYWIMRTEVTNAQYGLCVDAGACEPPEDGNRRYLDAQSAELPVSGVTWDQALAYAKWVGGRLPTEAEWEKACRGTDARNYPWGNQDPTSDLLNYSETGADTWNAVGSYPEGASPYGALDMAGNMWEWTSSGYGPYPYRPEDGREGPNADERVLRGGSFVDFDYGVRCAYRNRSLPSDKNVNIGFRVVVSPGS